MSRTSTTRTSKQQSESKSRQASEAKPKQESVSKSKQASESESKPPNEVKIKQEKEESAAAVEVKPKIRKSSGEHQESVVAGAGEGVVDGRPSRGRNKPASGPRTGNECKEKESAESKRVGPKKWHHFRVTWPPGGARSLAVLRGGSSILDKRFKPLSRGRQGSAAAAAALVYAQLSQPQDWLPGWIDRVLEYGDRLYRMSRASGRFGEDVYITTSLLQQEFFVGDYKCKICVEPGALFGNLYTDTAGAPNLSKGLKMFLGEQPSLGVLTSQATSVAIWTNVQYEYFYFDPGPSDEDGIRCPAGFACMIRVTDPEDILEVFTKSLNNNCDSRYCIDRLKLIKVQRIGREKYEGKCGAELETQPAQQIQLLLDVGEAKLDCAAAPTKKPGSQTEEERKLKEQQEEEQPFLKMSPFEGIKIPITNEAIEAKLASDPLTDQLLQDPRYAYEDTRVNLPTSLQPIPNDERLAILHGWTHQLSEMYKGKGAQSSANCAAAFAVRFVNPVRSWLRPSLDEVLQLGDALYADVKAEKPNLKVITSAELDAARIKVENKKLIIDVDLLTVTGTVLSKVSSVLNLKQGLDKFFLNNTDGILECSILAVSIWLEDDYYYMFDPRACDINGKRVQEDKKKEKKGKNEESGAKKVVAKCCVIRFPELSDLAGSFLNNLDPGLYNERYTIRKVGIVEDIPGIRDWNSFKPGGAGKSWILVGNTNRDDESFSEHSRDVQGLAMPVLALVAAKTVVPAKWSDEDVDDVVRYGDDYYNWCIPSGGEQIDEEEKVLNCGSLKKHLYYKQCKAMIDVKESCVVGNLTASPEDKQTLDLERGIQEFFQTHQFGVVEGSSNNNSQYFAIWKFEEELKDKSKEISYYLFNDKPTEAFHQRIPLAENNNDDTSRNKNTSNNKPPPNACLLRFLDHREIALLLRDELLVEADGNDDARTEFYIHEIKMTGISAPMSEEEIEQDKAVPIKPELRAYTSLGEAGAYLTGSFNQANETIFKRDTRNKQQAANALVILGMIKLFNPHNWRSEILDEVLRLADQLTGKNLKNIAEFPEENEEPRHYLLPSEIQPEFAIGVNDIRVTVEEEIASGSIEEPAKAFEEFFSVKKTGIYRLDEVMFPIWKEGNVYFTMDPTGKQNGNATIYWLVDVQQLVELIIELTDKADGLFFIDGVIAESSFPETEEETEEEANVTENKWYNFNLVSEGIWKIDCNITMTDESFKEENRAKQSAAICVMGIIFAKIYEPRHLSSEILDEITITGDKLHTSCAARLGEEKSLHPKEILSEFFLSNRRINLTIRDCVEAGTLGGRGTKIQDITSGLANFFEKSSAGCVTLPDNMNFSIWMYEKDYYCLTPGVSLMRLENRDLLAEELRIYGEDIDFEITSVNVVDWNKSLPWTYDPSPAVRPSNLPSYNAYSKLPGKARAILRGFSHQASEIFAEDIRGHQTASNCIIAIAMSIITSPTTWTRKRLDEILALGVTLHRESLKYLPDASLNLKPKDIIRIFHVGTNVLAIDVDVVVTGIVAHPPPEPEEKGKKKKAAKKPKDKKKKKKGKTRERPPPPAPILLEEGLKEFIENNNAGILRIDRFMVAIWKESGVYFMYDPRARNHEGLKVADDSKCTSCVTWFACTEPLFHLINANLCDDEKYAKYEISRVIVRTVPIEPLPSSAEYQAVHDNTLRSGKPGEASCPQPAILPGELQRQLRASDRLKLELDTAFQRLAGPDGGEASMLLGSIHLGPRDQQCSSAVALAALIVAGGVQAPSAWSPDLLDALLRHGRRLHSEWAGRLRGTGAASRNLSPAELPELLVVGDVRARVRLRPGLTAGLCLEHDLAAGLRLLMPSSPPPPAAAAGTSSCSLAIFHTAGLALPVIRHSGKYYFLEPTGRHGFAGSGRPAEAACLVKCESLTKLAGLIIRACCFDEPTVYTLNPVELLDLYFYAR